MVEIFIELISVASIALKPGSNIQLQIGHNDMAGPMTLIVFQGSDLQVSSLSFGDLELDQ